MPLGDALDDRQPESAAVRVGGVRRGPSVEPIEYARAIIGRYAWAGVAYLEHRLRALRSDDHIDTARRRRIANCVVDQVRDQCREGIGIAANEHRTCRVDAEVDA